MKATVCFLIVLFFLLPAFGGSVPTELAACDSKEFSFGDLKYYTEKELIQTYCNCLKLKKLQTDTSLILLEEWKLRNEHEKIMPSKENRESIEKIKSEVDMRQNQSQVAAGNASRIERILKTDFGHESSPNCE